jgi:hypothetical protein
MVPPRRNEKKMTMTLRGNNPKNKTNKREALKIPNPTKNAPVARGVLKFSAG